MKNQEKRKERIEKVKKFTAKNRLFILLAIVCCFYLLGTTIFGKETEPPKQDQTQAEIVQQQEPEHWRFYWIDVWVLAVGGGFCTVMIIREKKKAKEEIK